MSVAICPTRGKDPRYCSFSACEEHEKQFLKGENLDVCRAKSLGRDVFITKTGNVLDMHDLPTNAE